MNTSRPSWSSFVQKGACVAQERERKVLYNLSDLNSVSSCTEVISKALCRGKKSVKLMSFLT